MRARIFGRLSRWSQARGARNDQRSFKQRRWWLPLREGHSYSTYRMVPCSNLIVAISSFREDLSQMSQYTAQNWESWLAK